jgi:transcriptional regulator with GAF, ATPase, and Fis domain
MNATRAARALAEASAGLVVDHDVAGHVAALLRSCQDVLDAQAAGILLADDHDVMELLAASTHDAEDLELHQAQTDEGPCIDAFRTGDAVTATEPDDIVARWPRFGPALVERGFTWAHSSPLRWHGQPIGAMGLFRSTGEVLGDDESAVVQAFADLATVLIVQTAQVDLEALGLRVSDALQGRVVIERAKGAVAEIEGVDMAEAYRRLVAEAQSGGSTLTDVAGSVLERAQQHRRP